MNLIEAIIMSILDIVEYTIISKKLIYNDEADNYKINKVLLGVYILVFSLVAGFISNTLNNKYNVIMSGTFLIVMTFLIYRRKIKETIYIYGIATVIILLIQFCTVILLEVLGIGIGYTFIEGIIVHTISLSLTVIISMYVPIEVIFRYVAKGNKIFKFLILNVFNILISLAIYWSIDIDGILKNLIIISIISTGIILVNFVLLKNGLKNELEEQQLRIYEEYLPVIDELISEIRKRQHEFDNHIQALKMLTVTSKDYESIIGSMKHYMKDLEVTNDLKDLIKIDNKILAGFLYNKIKNAEKLNVQFDIIIQDYQFNTGLKDYELVEIMGNLINNAFETEVENNSVILTLLKERDMNVIEIRNKHPYLKKENLDKIFSKGFSTKSSVGRGFGLYNIKKIVEKYNGKIEVLNKLYSNENYVIFRILFIRK